MADICAVCDKKIGFFREEPQVGIFTHSGCTDRFLRNQGKYGGTVKTEADIEAEEKVEEEYVEQQQKIEDQSVYVKGFSMPFGEMVEFMVKWAIASIPAFIILFIIFGIFFAMFGAMFF